jgi:hypothetical protein
MGRTADHLSTGLRAKSASYFDNLHYLPVQLSPVTTGSSEIRNVVIRKLFGPVGPGFFRMQSSQVVAIECGHWPSAIKSFSNRFGVLLVGG